MKLLSLLKKFPLHVTIYSNPIELPRNLSKMITVVLPGVKLPKRRLLVFQMAGKIIANMA
jgi:hypothetical protein